VRRSASTGMSEPVELPERKEAGWGPASCSRMRFGGIPTIRTRVGEVGSSDIGARRAAAIPRPRDFRTSRRPILGDHNHSPPEPGFARREAHYEGNRPKREHLGRLLKQLHNAPVRKEGAHGGTRGSPVKRGAAKRPRRATSCPAYLQAYRRVPASSPAARRRLPRSSGCSSRSRRRSGARSA
jgi:hypothetical protein